MVETGEQPNFTWEGHQRILAELQTGESLSQIIEERHKKNNAGTSVLKEGHEIEDDALEAW